MGARLIQDNTEIAPRTLAKRVDQLVMRVGNRVRAAKTLGVGETTLDAALNEERLQKKTVARLVAALDREDEGDAPFFLGYGLAVNQISKPRIGTSEVDELVAIKFWDNSIPGSRVVDVPKASIHASSTVQKVMHRGDVVVTRRYAREQGWVTE